MKSFAEDASCQSRVTRDAQHLTRFAERFAISSDLISEGSFVVIVTPTTGVNKTLFYGQGVTLNISAQTTP